MTFKDKRFDKPVYVRARHGSPVVTVDIEVTINGYHHHIIRWQQDAGAVDTITAPAFGYAMDELVQRVKRTIMNGTQEDPPAPTPGQVTTARLHRAGKDFLDFASLACQCEACKAFTARPDYVAKYGEPGFMDEERHPRAFDHQATPINGNGARVRNNPFNHGTTASRAAESGTLTEEQRQAMMEGAPSWMPGDETQAQRNERAEREAATAHASGYLASDQH